MLQECREDPDLVGLGYRPAVLGNGQQPKAFTQKAMKAEILRIT